MGLVPRLGALGARRRPSVGAPHWPPLWAPTGLPDTAGGCPGSAGTCRANCDLPEPPTRCHGGTHIPRAATRHRDGGWGGGCGGVGEGLGVLAGVNPRGWARLQVTQGKQVLLCAAQPPTAASAFPRLSPGKPRRTPGPSQRLRGLCTGSPPQSPLGGSCLSFPKARQLPAPQALGFGPAGARGWYVPHDAPDDVPHVPGWGPR